MLDMYTVMHIDKDTGLSCKKSSYSDDDDGVMFHVTSTHCDVIHRLLHRSNNVSQRLFKAASFCSYF